LAESSPFTWFFSILFSVLGILTISVQALSTLLSFARLVQVFTNRTLRGIVLVLTLAYFLLSWIFRFGIQHFLDHATGANAAGLLLDVVDALLLTYGFWQLTLQTSRTYVGMLSGIFAQIGGHMDAMTMFICLCLIIYSGLLLGYAALNYLTGSYLDIATLVIQISATLFLFFYWLR
jgi:hypothetical protein